MMLGPGIMYWTETSLTFALALAVMLTADWRLAVFAILPAPAVSLAVIFFGRMIHARFERIQAMFSDISRRVRENLAGVRMVRAFAQEQAESRRFEELNKQYIAQNLKLVRIQGFFQPLLEALIGCAFLVVLLVGGYQVLRGRITPGGYVMHNTYMGMLVWPMIALGWVVNWVVNLMQRGTAKSSSGAFRWSTAGRALEGIGLRIPAGSTIAVVGHTGSGKSTLVSLVPRLMDPTGGAVTVDGRREHRFRSGERDGRADWAGG
jgi:ATP-binding cassette subfamily B protein